MKEAPAACVNREKTAWRQVRDASVHDKALRFCTGEGCWSYDLVSKEVSAIAKIVVIDQVNRTLLERTTPKPCARGTHRVN